MLSFCVCVMFASCKNTQILTSALCEQINVSCVQFHVQHSFMIVLMY